MLDRWAKLGYGAQFCPQLAAPRTFSGHVVLLPAAYPGNYSNERKYKHVYPVVPRTRHKTDLVAHKWLTCVITG